MKSLATKAFTLVEVVIAVGILLMVVGAAAVVIKQNIQATSANKHKTQAVGLAQEGANLVRGIRDKNLLTDVPTGAFTGIDPVGCAATTPCHLVNDGSGNWSLQSGPEEITLNGKKFTREIIIE